MIDRIGPHDLPLSRSISEDKLPQRVMLRLDDGYQSPVYVHQSPGEEKGLPVLYLHGIQSHPGWFAGSAAAIARFGWRVFQVTRRGSGENGADRGHVRSARGLISDVHAAARLAMERTGKESLHLLGVSWGGKLAACCAANAAWRDQLASLTLVAPGIAPRVDVSSATKLAIGLCLLAAPHRRFDIPLGEPEMFTDNEPMLRYLRNDGFALHRATARFLYASSRLDRMLRRARRGCISAPTTLLLADRDRIIDNERTQRVIEHLTDGRAEVRNFPAAHVLEFEPDPTFLHEALIEALSRSERDG